MIVDLGTHRVEATEEFVSGELNFGTPWAAIEGTKLYTNSFIIDEKARTILLGYKKRGLGQGMYNGFGGKVDVGETIYEAALRELKEEAGITSPLEHAGTLLFTSESSPLLHHIEIYRGSTWEGAVTESEEMRPQWFRIQESAGTLPGRKPNHVDDVVQTAPTLPSIPFEKMWADDPMWFPFLLSKRSFVGRVDFGESTVAGDWNSAPITRWWFGAPAKAGPLVS